MSREIDYARIDCIMKYWIKFFSKVFLVSVSLMPFGFAQEDVQVEENVSEQEVQVEEIEEKAEVAKIASEQTGKRNPRRNRSEGDLVSILNPGHLAGDRNVRDMVVIFSDSHAEGQIFGDYVTVMGNSHLEGDVSRDFVTVLGNAKIDGSIDRDMVVVLGNADLGPNARVNNVVVVGGALNRAEGSVIMGDTEEVPIPIPFGYDNWDKVHPFFIEGLAMGRFIVPDMSWTWYAAMFAVLMTSLLGAAFPKPANACIEALEQRPAQAFLAGIGFQLLGLPLVSIIMLILVATVIGILAMPFLSVGLLVMWLLSFVAVYGLIGRRFGLEQNIPLSVLVGGALVSIGYAVPFVGMLLFVSISLVGSGAVVIALFSSLSDNARSSEGSYRSIRRRAAVAEPGREEALAERELESSSLLYQDEEYEAVGFGPRLLAALIDLIIVAVTINVFDALSWFIDFGSKFLLIWLAYHVAFWVWKGTTLGGAALNLKVERINGGELTIGVALIRAFASILSFVCVGVGFFWASWDADRQSWHDKIAGTAIVKVPKGTSLI